MVFIWDDRGYLPVCFEYKMAYDRYLVAEIKAERFWVYLGKYRFSIFQQLLKLFTNISQHSKYSKQVGGYSLSLQ